MNFKKITAPSLKDLFVQQIQGLILSEELAMGERLPSERQLAEKMQVSRAVVNGGLSQLEKQGFIEVIPRQGTFVADYRRMGNLNTLIAIMEYPGTTLGKDEIKSILEIRWALERLTVTKAIENAPDDKIEELTGCLDKLRREKNISKAAALAFEFQHTLALIGDNNVLPLIYYSFKTPVITLWERFLRLYGVEALWQNTYTLYTHVKNRDLNTALNWIDTYLGKAIEGEQQIYREV